MFEQIFKRIDHYIWKDAGCDSELDYAEQTSWLLFLKWFDDFEKDKEKIFRLDGKKYKPTFDKSYHWSSWAVVKKKDGSIDHNKNLSGDDLINFINNKLFPYLGGLKDKSENLDTIEHKIGIIFSEIKNEIQDGYILRDVLEEVDSLEFRSDKQKHELSILYESKIKNMGNAGRTGGQYYTPRPLIRTIVKLVNPKIGETIYDGACGSGGFLVETYNHIKENKTLTVSELNKLQTKTIFGKEKKNLAYIIGLMNMILHGIEVPNIIKTNTLSENIMNFQEKDKVDVILANPPFGGGEQTQIQQNFPIRTSETAYLFLQHFIKKLKIGGRAGVIIKNTFLSNDDAILTRKELLETCNLTHILNLPKNVFSVGQKTVVLFFTKGQTTKEIFYYDLKLDRNLGATNPLNEEDLSEFSNYFNNKRLSNKSWIVDVKRLDKEKFDLTVKNPKEIDEVDKRNTKDIILNINDLNKKIDISLNKIKKML